MISWVMFYYLFNEVITFLHEECEQVEEIEAEKTYLTVKVCVTFHLDLLST
jgi:hypothetical protein